MDHSPPGAAETNARSIALLELLAGAAPATALLLIVAPGSFATAHREPMLPLAWVGGALGVAALWTILLHDVCHRPAFTTRTRGLLLLGLLAGVVASGFVLSRLLGSRTEWAHLGMLAIAWALVAPIVVAVHRAPSLLAR